MNAFEFLHSTAPHDIRDGELLPAAFLTVHELFVRCCLEVRSNPQPEGEILPFITETLEVLPCCRVVLHQRRCFWVLFGPVLLWLFERKARVVLDVPRSKYIAESAAANHHIFEGFGCTPLQEPTSA